MTRAQKLKKMPQVTLTTPNWEEVGHPTANAWYSLPCTKFDNFSFSSSRDMVAVHKIKRVTWPWSRPF